MTSVSAVLRQAALEAANKDFLIGWSSSHCQVEERVTFSEYLHRAALVAHSLDIDEGMPVALLSSPSIAHFVCIGGVYLGGGVVISFGWQQSPAALAHAVEALNPAVLVVSTSLVPLAKAAERLAPNFVPRRVLDGFDADALVTKLVNPLLELPPALVGEHALTKATVAGPCFTLATLHPTQPLLTIDKHRPISVLAVPRRPTLSIIRSPNLLTPT